MGWKIFVHSFRMVIDNLGAALRVSAMLYLLQIVLQVLVYRQAAAGGIGIGEQSGILALLALLSVLGSIWIAVGWHRFVLSGESPSGWVPRWHGRALMSYLGRSLAIGLLLGVGLALLMALVFSLGAAFPGLLGLMTFGMGGLASYLLLRLGPVLPAAALETPLTLREAWRATGQDDKAVLMLALISMGAQFLVGLPGWIDGDTESVVSLVYSIVLGWFVMMIGASVLTTLYGHFVEGRPIR